MCHKLCHLIWGRWRFHGSKDFEAMKAGKLAIWPWLSCRYTENMDEPWIHIRSASHWYCLELQLCIRHPTKNIIMAQNKFYAFSFFYIEFSKNWRIRIFKEILILEMIPIKIEHSLLKITNDNVHIFWEDHKILRKLHRIFDWHFIGQIYGGDFGKTFLAFS